MQQNQSKHDFRSIVSQFCVIGIVFFVFFTLVLYFYGAPMLELFGSGFMFIGLLFIIFFLMAGIFLFCIRFTRTVQVYIPVAAISFCVPGMFLETVILRFLDQILAPLAAFPLEFSSILMFAYASVIAVSLIYYRI